MSARAQLPFRLHHYGWIVDDQEVNRRFYEEVVGLPLIATWTEVEMIGDTEYALSHTFYGLADGSALAFFQMADPGAQERFNTSIAPTPMRHIALKVDRETQDAVRDRLAEAGYAEPETFVVDHGYCVSLYTVDPNGLQLEFTVDHPEMERINAKRLRTAHADLARWLGGDHRSNNEWRVPGA
ncbi:VOC family protein [Streptomyces bohaiensis]|uniref:VOC family protein n=1 Tax=Streptomyces bohaiensis TaxID=1431344 RepID=A0ABX1CD97_9ACTN|nr:VOC family protein [Streptomyces bohaiensis]NJQ15144.1 VOC family protein [Streptomyces bohaiensis]